MGYTREYNGMAYNLYTSDHEHEHSERTVSTFRQLKCSIVEKKNSEYTAIF